MLLQGMIIYQTENILFAITLLLSLLYKIEDGIKKGINQNNLHLPNEPGFGIEFEADLNDCLAISDKLLYLSSGNDNVSDTFAYVSYILKKVDEFNINLKDPQYNFNQRYFNEINRLAFSSRLSLVLPRLNILVYAFDKSTKKDNASPLTMTHEELVGMIEQFKKPISETTDETVAEDVFSFASKKLEHFRSIQHRRIIDVIVDPTGSQLQNCQTLQDFGNIEIVFEKSLKSSFERLLGQKSLGVAFICLASNVIFKLPFDARNPSFNADIKNELIFAMDMYNMETDRKEKLKQNLIAKRSDLTKECIFQLFSEEEIK